MHKYWGYASLVAVTLWTFGVAAQTDLSELEDLANDCDKKPAWLSNKSQEVLYFAPMTRIELTEAERAQEKFGYEYATTTRRYPLAS